MLEGNESMQDQDGGDPAYDEFRFVHPGRRGCNFKTTIFKLVMQQNTSVTRCGIAFIWMPQWTVSIGLSKGFVPSDKKHYFS